MTMFKALPLLIFLTLPLASCGDEDVSERSDGGGELQTANDKEGDSELQIEEMDDIISRYYDATDSLASIFSSIKTVADADSLGPEIERLNREIWEFNRLSVQYGTPLMERMDAANDDGSLERLFTARDELRKNEVVYKRVEAIEAKTGSGVTEEGGE